MLRHRGTIVYVRCNENCSVDAAGTLLIGHRKLRSPHVKAALVADRRARLRMRLRPRAQRLLRRALRHGGHPRVRLRLRATTRPGNRSALVRRGVRVRR